MPEKTRMSLSFTCPEGICLPVLPDLPSLRTGSELSERAMAKIVPVSSSKIISAAREQSEKNQIRDSLLLKTGIILTGFMLNYTRQKVNGADDDTILAEFFQFSPVFKSKSGRRSYRAGSRFIYPA